MKTFLRLVTLILIFLGLAACRPASTPPTDNPPVSTSVVKLPTEAPVPTNTLAPTNTPAPIDSPVPTNTPAPTNTPPPPESEEVSFTTDVLPIFQANCVRCHSDTSILGAPPNNLRLIDYENILKGSAFGPVILPGNPDSSSLVIMLRKGTMPADADPLSDDQIQTIVAWIVAGAPDN